MYSKSGSRMLFVKGFTGYHEKGGIQKNVQLNKAIGKKE